MHCGSVQIDCRRCLCAKVSSLFVEIQRGDVVFTAYADEHGAVLNSLGCVMSHTFDCSPCSPSNNAVLLWPAEGNTRLTGTATEEAGLSPCFFLRQRTRHGKERHITREDQYGATTASHSQGHGGALSWQRH